MSAKRRIAIVTGGRPDYGLLRWLIQDVHDAPDCELQLVVTGMHFAAEFGRTVDEIRRDGLPIAAEVDTLASGDTPLAAAQSTGRGVVGCAEAFDHLRPAIVVVLGDRFEILAAAQAAMLLGMPIAHLHGGETTEGSMDEFIRHAITKLASLHFVSTAMFRDRVIRMGEQPDRVYNFGAIGLDQLTRLTLPDRGELVATLGLAASDPFLLATYHAATRGGGDPVGGARAMLSAFDRFPQLQTVITHANADPGGRAINALLQDYAAKRRDGRAVVVPALGSRLYLGAVRHAAAVIGNSSSGLIEAPAVGTPTVNIGPRQKGRPRAVSVIDCDESEGAIVGAIARAIDPAFRAGAERATPPYGRPGNVSQQILQVLRQTDVARLFTKPFYDTAS
jgi:UDP-hydrolysing UDP-N-acetyl-D-glucosamine 2-epimerase